MSDPVDPVDPVEKDFWKIFQPSEVVEAITENDETTAMVKGALEHKDETSLRAAETSLVYKLQRAQGELDREEKYHDVRLQWFKKRRDFFQKYLETIQATQSANALRAAKEAGK